MTIDAPSDDHPAVIDHRFVVTNATRTWVDDRIPVIDDRAAVVGDSSRAMDDGSPLATIRPVGAAPLLTRNPPERHLPLG